MSVTTSQTAFTFAQQGDVWKPRLKAFVGADGISNPTALAQTLVPTVLSAKTHKNSWLQADRFQLTFALFADPTYSYGFWTGFNDISVRVQIAFEGVVDYTDVFRGFADKIVIDAIKGIVTVTGRNQLAPLLDKFNFSYKVNQTTHEIILDMFKEAELNPPVFNDFPDQLYGRVYQEDKTTTARGPQSTPTSHDLVVAITQQFGGSFHENNDGVIEFWVNPPGNTYQFIAPQPVFQNGVTTFEPSNLTGLTIEHDLQFSRVNHVMMSTTFDANGKGYTAKWPPDVELGPFVRAHHVINANKTQEDNAAFAQSLHNEFMVHEWLVSMSVAGPQLIATGRPILPGDLLNISGVGDPVDGGYQIDVIEHSIDFRRGYKGMVRGKWGTNQAQSETP